MLISREFSMRIAGWCAQTAGRLGTAPRLATESPGSNIAPRARSGREHFTEVLA